MGSLIDKGKVVDKISDLFLDKYETKANSDLTEVYKEVLKILVNDKGQPWISVKDRLPNEDDIVLVTNNQLDFKGYADVYTAVYKYNNWYDWCGNEIERIMIGGPVTHWSKAIELPYIDKTACG